MKRILVVDDQPDNVFILQDRLEQQGFEVLSAYDGQSGIDKARDEQPDLILLDVMMPGMSGFEVCREIVQNELTKNIPIILVTALTGSEDIKEGLQAGAFDYIKKPFNKIELIARINSALKYSETNQLLLELEKVKTFAATVVTTNHEIKQPLTLINLSTAALRRELNKDTGSKDKMINRIAYIENATKEIIKVLDKMSSIRKPVMTDYINNLKMIDLNANEKKNSTD
jgi:two-component system cell cycle response regulator